MALCSKTNPKYIFHPQTYCMQPTAAALFSLVQEFTGARPNYYKKCPAEAKGRKQDMQTGGGHGQARPCTQALCVTYCTTITRVRFKILASVVCHHVRQTWSFSFNGHAHNALPPMNSEQCPHLRHNTQINTQEYASPKVITYSTFHAFLHKP